MLPLNTKHHCEWIERKLEAMEPMSAAEAVAGNAPVRTWIARKHVQLGSLLLALLAVVWGLVQMNVLPALGGAVVSSAAILGWAEASRRRGLWVRFWRPLPMEYLPLTPIQDADIQDMAAGNATIARVLEKHARAGYPVRYDVYRFAKLLHGLDAIDRASAWRVPN
jgi:hypothetical protein